MAIVNNWDYKDRHIDENIKPSEFLSGARVIIYSAVRDVAPGPGGISLPTGREFKPIGVIQNYSFSEQRQIEQIFELGSERMYQIPGRTMGRIQLSRILISGRDLTNVLHGGADTDSGVIRSLKDANVPFDMVFCAFKNTSGTTQPTSQFSRQFVNCWVESRSESVAAQSVIVAENCSVTYENISNVKFDSSGVGVGTAIA